MRVKKRMESPEFKEAFDSMTQEQIDQACGLASDAVEDTSDISILGLSGGIILGWLFYRVYQWVKSKFIK